MEEKLKKITENEEFCNKLAQCDDADEALRLLASEGIEMTRAEFEDRVSMGKKALQDAGYLKEEELSEEALDGVAGGVLLTTVLAVTAGVLLLADIGIFAAAKALENVNRGSGRR